MGVIIASSQAWIPSLDRVQLATTALPTPQFQHPMAQIQLVGLSPPTNSLLLRSRSTYYRIDIRFLSGSICPAGFFCVEGSSWPSPCPPGTYSDQLGLQNATDCFSCLGGEFCASYNLTLTSGNCSEGYFQFSPACFPSQCPNNNRCLVFQGYYCPGNDITATSVSCPIGHFCPEQSPHPILCPSGYYQVCLLVLPVF